MMLPSASILFTSSVLLHVTCALTKHDVLSAIDTSLFLGHQELGKQRALNEHLLAVGIDDKEGKTKSTGRATCMHQLSDIFCHMNNQTFAQADQAFIALHATKVLSNKFGMSLVELQNHPLVSSIWRKLYGKTCMPRMPMCPPVTLRYRTPDGSCNNIQHPRWGMSYRPQNRYLPPVYDDGISSPRVRSVTGKALPGARLISNVIHQPVVNNLFENTQSVMVMQFGQLLDHDLTDTPMSKGAKKADIECCKISPHLASKRPACFPIPIPLKDPHFRTHCMNFVRSTAGTPDDCRIEHRNQINQLTAYVDASFLYGNDVNEMKRLRMFHGGKLVMDHRGLFGEHEDDRNCMKEHPGDYCMKSGDRKIHVVPTLTAIEVVFLREHNRIAKKLLMLNPHWNDERLYQTTRSIIMAMNAHISYNEYLPIILGPGIMMKYGLHSREKGFDTRYNPKIDVTITNVFAVAAFRFGHSQVPGFVGLINRMRGRTQTNLEDTYNKPFVALVGNGAGCDKINRWQVREPAGKQDQFLERAVRDELFLDDDGESFDLAALNIQRGRDHGIPGYNAWRRWCGLSPAIHFGKGPGGLVDIDPEAALRLSHIFKHPEDIDVYVAGLAEILLPRATVGPTFACILGKQFHDLKYGDRFWYENDFPGIAFTEAQLRSIKNVRMSRLMCNSLHDPFIQNDVFHIPSLSNPEVPCQALADVDLHLWKDRTFIKMMLPFSPLANLMSKHMPGS